MNEDKKRAVMEWYESLNEVERLAVDYWLTTGRTDLIDHFKPQSERLQQYNVTPFAVVQTDTPAMSDFFKPICLN